jgi:hypothetical protein
MMLTGTSGTLAPAGDKEGNFILDASGNKIKSIFGIEIDHLKANGYTILSDGITIK